MDAVKICIYMCVYVYMYIYICNISCLNSSGTQSCLGILESYRQFVILFIVICFTTLSEW